MHEPKPAFLMHIFLYKMQSESESGRAGGGVGAGRVGFQRQGFRPPTTGRAPTFSARSYGFKSSGNPHPFLPHPANSFKLNLRAYTASGGSLTSSVSNQAAELRRLPSVASGMAAHVNGSGKARLGWETQMTRATPYISLLFRWEHPSLTWGKRGPGKTQTSHGFPPCGGGGGHPCNGKSSAK